MKIEYLMLVVATIMIALPFLRMYNMKNSSFIIFVGAILDCAAFVFIKNIAKVEYKVLVLILYSALRFIIYFLIAFAAKKKYLLVLHNEILEMDYTNLTIFEIRKKLKEKGINSYEKDIYAIIKELPRDNNVD